MEYLHPENYIQMNFIQMHLNEKYADRRTASFALK